MIADGIATALFMTEPTILLSQYDFQYVRMHASGSIDYSRSLEGQLFL
jgi:thiamine biosynthesis lipoprotein